MTQTTDSQTTDSLTFNQLGFDTFLASQKEPQWLTQMRCDAWQHFNAMRWPDRRHEEWLRTDIRAFQIDKFGIPATEAREVPSRAQLREGVELGGSIETVDSYIVSESLDAELANQGVLFGSLSRMGNEHSDLVRKYFFTAFDPDYDKFAAAHAAFWSGGQFLFVPKGVVLKKPLYIGSSMTDGGTDTTHTLIVLEEGAEATVLHESNGSSEQSKGLQLGAIEVIQKANSHLRYVNLQEWGYGTYQFGHQKALVGRDASLQWTIAAMGSLLSKVNQSVELIDAGASCQVNGVLFTEGRQNLAYHTLQHHRAPSCRSDFLYKSAQQDKSRTVWRGMIKVDPIAQKTDGYQRNDNLVLSESSRADSIPGLEIEADDVRCTHGSTTSKVDEEQIFYAQCRGFSRKEATRMIVSGFFQQIFDRITIESVREALGAAIARQVREYE